MAGYRLLEHTADVGIEAWAGSVAELFRQLAAGLYEVIGLKPGGEGEEAREVTVAGGDREELLVAWLSELLYLAQAEEFVAAAFAFTTLEATRLRARLTGSRPGAGEEPEREVKAVTYHRLEVAEDPEGWRARVYLDL